MVKKITKYLKFAVCCTLILSLIAPSYAALSASDGSAFVTKAEFDSALADFNARLTTFEAGINSKIDSQVSSYLDRNGIWNGKVQTLIPANKNTIFKFDETITYRGNAYMPTAMMGNLVNNSGGWVWSYHGNVHATTQNYNWPDNGSGSAYRTNPMTNLVGKIPAKSQTPISFLGIWPIKVVCDKSGLLEWHYSTKGGMAYQQLWELRSFLGDNVDPANACNFIIYTWCMDFGLITCDLPWFVGGDEVTDRCSNWCRPDDFTIRDSMSYYNSYGFQMSSAYAIDPLDVPTEVNYADNKGNGTGQVGDSLVNYGIYSRVSGQDRDWSYKKFPWPFGEYIAGPAAAMDLPKYTFVSKNETLYLTSWINSSIYVNETDQAKVDAWLPTVYLGFAQSGGNGSLETPEAFASRVKWKIY